MDGIPDETNEAASAAPAWDAAVCDRLIDELTALRARMCAHEARLQPWLCDIDRRHHDSARNLAHYLALRQVDLRPLQERLAWVGLSSLGRAESHVLANLDKVLGLLHLVCGRPWTPHTADEPLGYQRGRAALARNAEQLFGPPPEERAVRIMVTLPGAAAHDRTLVAALVSGGMDIARINCAHDDAAHWIAMAGQVRAAARAAGRSVRVLMDLGGPKLRTGPLPDGPAVSKIKPQRDALGAVSVPARVGLRARAAIATVPGAQWHFEVDPDWLAHLRPGDRIDLVDARGAERTLTVIDCGDAGALVECARTAYVTPDVALRLLRRHVQPRESPVSGIAATPGALILHRGDRLHLVRDGIGRPAGRRRSEPATIACTLPQALAAIAPGARIWFDDGRIGGVVRRRIRTGVEIEITVARDGGEALRSDKGINLPDTDLRLPALTAQDLDDLTVVARHADLVGLSFAQSADDVRTLRRNLCNAGAPQLGLILKIETQRGFEHLPEMLFAAMGAPVAGVMIARGDLAVECGYERLAEVQEQILWACEAAHVPVVWATQVLETLAKSGLPSRAEITDAAMGERAECVMLNKGPHILDALRMLDDILERMQSHQSKKRPLMRALKAWTLPPAASSAARPHGSAPRARPAGTT